MMDVGQKSLTPLAIATICLCLVLVPFASGVALPFSIITKGPLVIKKIVFVGFSKNVNGLGFTRPTSKASGYILSHDWNKTNWIGYCPWK